MSAQKRSENINREWWRGAFLYQIYPRSFMDTSGDGNGDLPGIIEKLDYIAGLGVDGIWISPFFKTPMKDFGYDVSDYRDVDPMFGTLDDFDRLLEKAHDRGLKIIIDLVLSHTSNEHPWFQDESKKDYYVWADPKEDGSPPNNWVSVFGGPAWSFSNRYGQYYLHNFLPEQPDLNYHNPAVQEEALDTARFWLERGVDGFRLDVVNFYFHDEMLRDNPPRTEGTRYATQLEAPDPYNEQQHIYDKSRPENLEFLGRLRALMDEYDARFTVGEIGDDHPYARASEYTAGNEYLNTSYNTHLMSGTHKTMHASMFIQPIEIFLKEPGGGWPSWAFSNHDVVRAASRWCPHGEGFDHNRRLSRMLIVLLGCLRGTVFMYQGEELGLPEARLTFEQLHDPWGKHLWPTWQGRDGCRTPMPWNRDIRRDQWLPVPDTHMNLTVEEQEQDPHSTLNFTRAFVDWRKKNPALVRGDIEFRDSGQEHVLIFTRTLGSKIFKCRFDFEDYSFELSSGPSSWTVESFFKMSDSASSSSSSSDKP